MLVGLIVFLLGVCVGIRKKEGSHSKAFLAARATSSSLVPTVKRATLRARIGYPADPTEPKGLSEESA